MQDHFPMIPFFKTRRPRRTVYMCARQLGKSVGLGASSLIRCKRNGDYDILGIQPRFEQIKRFSNNYVDRMLDSPLASEWLKDDSRNKGILVKPIKGGGSVYYAHAFLSPDATRGFAVKELNIDECQDIPNSFIPIIEEVLSAQTEFGLSVFSGTPKSLENTLAAQFFRSSEGYIHIKCDACNFENIANKDNHIYQMIGKKGCICKKCGRLLDLRKMYVVHRYPERRRRYEGYHIPQIVHPLHAYYPEKWIDLLEKLDDPMIDEPTFENEVLGLPSSHSDRPITEAEIREVCVSSYPNTEEHAVLLAAKASVRVLGVDWSGFGSKEKSTTAVTLNLAFPGTDQIHVPFMERLNLGADAIAEANRLKHLFRIFKCDYFAHDFSGAGTIREALMSQMGINARKFIPFDIVHAPIRKSIISFYKPPGSGRSCYNIDKTRSLMVLFQMIKAKKILFPAWEHCKQEVSDLLNITQETRSNPRGSDFIIMDKAPETTDDFTHSVNFGCSTIWHSSGKYPKMAPMHTEEDYTEVEGGPDERRALKDRLKKLNIKPTLV